MQPASLIVIPDAYCLDALPLEQGILYRNLLSAIADEATELRFETGGEFGKAWCRIHDKDYEMVPTPRDEVEKAIRALAREGNDASNSIQFRVIVAGASTEAIASIEPSRVVVRFLNPATASKQAIEIARSIAEQLGIPFV